MIDEDRFGSWSVRRTALFRSVPLRNLEADMNDPTPFHNQQVQRFVPDFDTLADRVQKRIDRYRRRVPHEALPAAEMEYTTEWQLEPCTETASSP